MKSKYQLNVRPVNNKKRNRSLLIYLSLIVLILCLMVLSIKYFLLPNTKINHGKPLTTKISSQVSSKTDLKTYTASDFSFKMSPGWTPVVIKNSPYHLYEWQDGKGANYQTVDVFEDSNTSHFAVNKVIIVESNSNQIFVLGPPSDNCANFTNGTKTSTLTGYPAKWMGVEFYCNLNTVTSDTVGISSAQAINSVNLVSPTGAAHSFYFLYTDHAITPNYSDFEELLGSFSLQ